MSLEIKQEGVGIIEICHAIPTELKDFVIAPAAPTAFWGENFKGLMQEFKGAGFSAWYSRYWMTAPVVLSARGDIPVLELRISLKNMIRGSWERIQDAELPLHHFQMGFVPHILTRAIFEGGKEYETFDIHFDLHFLTEIGIDYKTLDLFIRKVGLDEPAELSPVHHPCSPMMLDAINAILHNSYSIKGKAWLIRNNVTNILIGALETLGRDEMEKLPLSSCDIEALYHVRDLIEASCPVYLGNDVLVMKARPTLNAFKLSYGFKRLFGINPYEYYLERRFMLAKKLLLEGNTVTSVANELEYESATTFIKAFRKRFEYTPKKFQLNGG
ncbi:MAG: AraC family transcriptional regulator [Bacteroidota bacterium]|nr:AraC family transcriptional regulator [Bacteroidota bacterium]